jgi:hypothetical protein
VIVLQVLLLFLLDLVGDTLIQAFLELFFNLVPASIRHALNDWEDRHPVFQLFGWCLIGAVLGAVSLLLVPRPIFQHTRFHGVSLLLSPLLTGLVMDRFGKSRAAAGKPRLPLATFQNGASFGAGFAIVRLLSTRLY